MDERIEKEMRRIAGKRTKPTLLLTSCLAFDPTSTNTAVKSSQMLVRTRNECAKTTHEDEIDDDERIVATSLKKQKRCEESFIGTDATGRRLTPQLQQQQQQKVHVQRKQVRFASYAIVNTIPPPEENCWYERKDYDSFEIDCRQSIVAFLTLRSKKATMTTTTTSPGEATTSSSSIPSELQPLSHHAIPTNVTTVMEGNDTVVRPSQREENDVTKSKPKWYFTMHGLDDFMSIEAKLLRTRRRLVHCYNVLYHQWLLQEQTGINHQILLPTPTTIACTTVVNAIRLRQMAQMSSFESLRLALDRGQSTTVTTDATITAQL